MSRKLVSFDWAMKKILNLIEVQYDSDFYYELKRPINIY